MQEVKQRKIKQNNKTKLNRKKKEGEREREIQAHRNEFVNLLNAVQLYEIFFSFIKLHLTHIKWLSHDFVNALLFDFYTFVCIYTRLLILYFELAILLSLCFDFFLLYVFYFTPHEPPTTTTTIKSL